MESGVLFIAYVLSLIPEHMSSFGTPIPDPNERFFGMDNQPFSQLLLLMHLLHF